MRFTACLCAVLFACSFGFAAKPFTFVQITDTHITTSARFAPNLRAIIAEVNGMNPKPAFVLCTGDETEMGWAEEYATYNEIVSAFEMPVYKVMGNHETKWSNWGKQGGPRFLQSKP